MGFAQLLVNRLSYPVPAIKWWASQGIAAALCNETTRQEVAASLRSRLRASTLEMEAVENLIPFWLAHTCGYRVESDLSACVLAASPLSSMILSACGVKESQSRLSAPLIAAPSGFREPRDLTLAKGRSVTRRYWSDLERHQRRTGYPFMDQFAFEWEQSKSRAPIHGSNWEYFIRGARSGQTGQFITQQTHRGLSAYVRTLMFARAHWGMPHQVAREFSLEAFQIDPVLAWMKPCPPPFQLPRAVARDQSQIDDLVREVAAQATSVGLVIGAISFSVRFGDEEWLDLTIALWEGGDAEADSGDDGEDPISRFYAQVITAPDDMEARVALTDDETNARSVRPLFGAGLWGHYAAYHWELFSRGWFVPLSSENHVVGRLRADRTAVEYFIGHDPLAFNGFWNEGWQPSHLKEMKPRNGAYCLARPASIKRLATPGKHLVWRWQAARWSRKAAHGDGDVEHMAGCIPGPITDD